MTSALNEIGVRWRRRKDVRPQELLAAAYDLFLERGYAATRLDDVASRAGVSKGTLYLYFTNKEDLFKTVVKDYLLTVLDDSARAITQQEGGSRDRLRELIMRWWHNIGESKLSGLAKLVQSESGRFPEIAKFYHDEFMARVSPEIERALARIIECGEMRSLNPASVTQLIVAQFMILMQWKHTFDPDHGKPMSPMTYLNFFSDLLLSEKCCRST